MTQPKFKMFEIVHVLDEEEKQPDAKIYGIEYLGSNTFHYKVGGGRWYLENEIVAVVTEIKNRSVFKFERRGVKMAIELPETWIK